MAVLLICAQHFTEVLARNTSYLLGQAHFLAPSNLFGVQYLLDGNVKAFFWTLAPLSGLILVAAVGANIMQVGLKVTPQAMAFQWSRLNPISGAKKFFQKRTFFDLLKNVAKVGLISLLAGLVIRSEMTDLNALSLLPIPGIVDLARGGFLKLMIVLLSFLALLAVVDWFFQRHQHAEELKMSRQEVKEEYKEFEGDPQIKARIRAIQIEASRRRMLTDVPRADVVITNPTHFAVALKYEPGKAAPVVLAKGADFLAKKIREVARESRVPVVENKPVARALYAEVEVGHPIPENLYQIVAEILAYVYRLRKA